MLLKKKILERGRQNNYDLLRVYAMLMVILNHVSDYYLIKTNYTCEEVFLFEGLSHCAVPVFLMLTGAFLIDKTANVKPKQFYLRAFNKLMVPTLIFMVIYWIHDFRLGKINSVFEALEGLKTGFTGLYAHWYVFMLVGIYAVLPVVSLVKSQVSRHSYEKFVILYFVWAMLSRHFESNAASWTIGNSLTFIGYVFVGDAIKQRIKRKNNYAGITCVIMSAIILLIDYYVLYVRVQHGDSYYNQLFGLYAAPLVIAGSLLLFIGFGLLSVKFSTFFLAKNSFIVYLCHKLVLEWLEPVFNKLEFMSSVNLTIIILIKVVFALSISLIIAMVFNTLYEKFQKFIQYSFQLGVKDE